MSSRIKTVTATTPKEDYDSMAALKFKNLQQEVQKGFDSLDRGDFSSRIYEEILE